jgi:DNA-binding MarR family transcriptional regulator
MEILRNNPKEFLKKFTIANKHSGKIYSEQRDGEIMLENKLLLISNKLRLQFYKEMFGVIREREGSLSAMEAFSVDVIHALGNPTVSEFADFIGISRPGASYKVASLIEKGYIKKEVSEEDKREYRLVLTDKYYNYIKMYEDSFKASVLESERNLTKEQLESILASLDKMDTAL